MVEKDLESRTSLLSLGGCHSVLDLEKLAVVFRMGQAHVSREDMSESESERCMWSRGSCRDLC